MLKVIQFPWLPFSIAVGIPFKYNVLGAVRVMVVGSGGGGRDRKSS